VHANAEEVANHSSHSDGVQTGSRSRSISTIAIWGLTGFAIVIGIAIRGWYIFHEPTSSDEDVVGLMVQQILHGHFSAFYWGQSYGGVEPYLVAPLFAVFGWSIWTLKSVSVILAVCAAAFTWRIAGRLIHDPAVAALAGAIVWAAPQSGVWNSTLELGFRGVTMACGTGLILLSLRVFEGRRAWHQFALLGLVTGLGWWSSPEIVYFVVPTIGILAAAVYHDRPNHHWHQWFRGLLLAFGSAILGALPWIWANANSGFRSLNQSSFAVPPNAPSYTGRLHIYLQYMLPMLFSLRAELSGAWIWLKPISIAIYILLLLFLLASLAICLLRDACTRSIAVGVVLFPFVLAASPATWYWGDGRYANLGFPLIVLVMVVGAIKTSEWIRAFRKNRAGQKRLGLVATLMAIVLGLAVVSFGRSVVPPSRFFAGWGNPNGPSIATIASLDRHHIRYGFADYWLAYKLDFLSDGYLQLTTVGSDVDRWKAQHDYVLHRPEQAWLFANLSAPVFHQFGDTTALQGPNGMSEAQFLQQLQRLNVKYRLVQLGLLEAVVPTRAVSPAAVGQGP